MGIVRAQLVYDLGGEPTAITTHDFKVTADPWPAAAPANYEGIEELLTTALNAGWKPFAWAGAFARQVRWYREDDEAEPWGEPARVTNLGIVGTGGATMLPPQVAVAITEHTASVRHWGRFYLPYFDDGETEGAGYVKGTILATIANAWEAFYEGCPARGLTPSVRGTRGVTLAATLGGTAATKHNWPIQTLSVDNSYDVIRRRKHEAFTRLTRALANQPPGTTFP